MVAIRVSFVFCPSSWQCLYFYFLNKVRIWRISWRNFITSPTGRTCLLKWSRDQVANQRKVGNRSPVDRNRRSNEILITTQPEIATKLPFGARNIGAATRLYRSGRNANEQLGQIVASGSFGWWSVSWIGAIKRLRLQIRRVGRDCSIYSRRRFVMISFRKSEKGTGRPIRSNNTRPTACFFGEMHFILPTGEYGAYPADYLSPENTKLTTPSADRVLLLDANLFSHKSKIKIKTKHNHLIASSIRFHVGLSV